MSEKTEAEKGDGKTVEIRKEVDGPPSPKRVKMGDKNDFKKVTRDALLSKFHEQDGYVDYLEEKLKQSSNNGELTSLRESEEKLKLQQQESTRRENVLVMRLATKEQEMQELLTQIHDLKQSQNPAGAQLRSTLLDPAVNIVFQRMKSELDETKEKLEQAQNDLSAWKFTPDSVTGKKLMAKCRMLIQENQELGRQLSQGRVAQLEAELALQKKYSEELKTSQDELNEFVIQLDEEVEGMQSTILALQKQLKGVKYALVEEKEIGEKQVEQIRVLEQNLDQARTQPPSPVEDGKQSNEPMQCDADTNDDENMTEDIEEPTKRTESPTKGSESPTELCESPTRDSESPEDVSETLPQFSENLASGAESPAMGGESPAKGGESPAKGGESPAKGGESPANFAESVTEENEDIEMRTEGENHTKPDENTELREPTTCIRMAPPVAPPPCPTTFSISQILGQTKKISYPVEETPMQSSPGGDAVVTKIAYLQGVYTDPSVGELRTEGTTVVNGSITRPAEDGTQSPIVT